MIRMLTVSGTFAVALIGVTGCQTPGATGNVSLSASDRLMSAYPELAGGRFAIIADFEDPAHMQIVQGVSVSNTARFVWNAERGRSETGRGALVFRAGSPHDTIVISNAGATDWSLKRDWRAYDLLLLSVESPIDGVELRATIAGGPAHHRLALETTQRLFRGWNLVRWDLAELAERIPSDDIQEVRLALSAAALPVEVALDDLILAGNREDLLGDSAASSGALYVQRAGRRWNVGAGGRFELVFANGQIVGWYNTAADPHRLRNLVYGTTLGPSPVVLESGTDLGDFSALGRWVQTTARIVEMNPVRVVIASEWRLTDEPDQPARQRPVQRWRYTIHRDGQMFVKVESTRQTSAWSAHLGLAVTLLADTNDALHTQNAGGPVGKNGAETVACAWVRRAEEDAFLLFVPAAPPGAPMRVFEQFDATRRRASLVAAAAPVEDRTQSWSGMVFLGANKAVSREEALARAKGYARAPRPRIDWGTAGPSPDGSGYDPAEGTYSFTPDQERVRVVFDGSVQPLFSPTVRILGSAGREAWVYVNHLIHSEVHRDADGELLFQLPNITGVIQVEVLFREDGS